MSNSKFKFFCVILFLIVLLFPIFSTGGKTEQEKTNIRKIYFGGQFDHIIEKYKDFDLTKETDEFKFLYIESMIRSGENREAEILIKKIKNESGSSLPLRILEGFNSLSRGDLVTAAAISDSLSNKNRDSGSLLQLKLFVEMFKRNFNKAEVALKNLLDRESGFGNSNLYFLIASEVFRTGREFKKLSSLYKGRMKRVNKRTGRTHYENLKLNYKLYKAGHGIFFHIDSVKDKIEIPFETGNRGSLKSIVLKRGDKKYSILLDTGNTAGWIIHNRDLNEELRSLRGGRIIMQIGTESEKLDGFNIFNKSVGFGEFKISGLFGKYIPKPRQDFFDANLNPAMISNRVISLDFIRGRLIIRTDERFISDIAKSGNMEVLKVPWFGYKYPMVPVICNSINGLAVIETGAENISVRNDFALETGISLSERSRYLSNGKVFKYSLGSVNVQLGKYLFVRKEAEIWPLKRFRNYLTGFVPHVIIGPEALDKKFIVSFIPKENVIVFEYEKRN